LKRIPTPKTKLGRIVLGVLLIIGGILGFLPILGFWMIPLGLVILSHDFHIVRRFRRRWSVKLSRLWTKHVTNRRS
jgi:purine-cytosine permease-like protein